MQLHVGTCREGWASGFRPHSKKTRKVVFGLVVSELGMTFHMQVHAGLRMATGSRCHIYIYIYVDLF